VRHQIWAATIDLIEILTSKIFFTKHKDGQKFHCKKQPGESTKKNLQVMCCCFACFKKPLNKEICGKKHKHQKTSCVFLSDSLCPFVVSGNWKKVRDLGLDWRMGAEHFEWFGTEVGMCGCVCGVNGLWGGGGDSPSLPWCSLRFLNFQWIWLDCLTNWDVIPLLFPKVC